MQFRRSKYWSAFFDAIFLQILYFVCTFQKKLDVQLCLFMIMLNYFRTYWSLILCHWRDFSIFVAFFATWKSNLDWTIQPDHFWKGGWSNALQIACGYPLDMEIFRISNWKCKIYKYNFKIFKINLQYKSCDSLGHKHRSPYTMSGQLLPALLRLHSVLIGWIFRAAGPVLLFWV